MLKDFSTKSLSNTLLPNSKLTKNAKSTKASILNSYTKDQVQAELARRKQRGVYDVTNETELVNLFRNYNRSLPPNQKKPTNRWINLLKDRKIDWKNKSNEYILEKLITSKPKKLSRRMMNQSVEDFRDWLKSQPNNGVGKLVHIVYLDSDGVQREWYYNIREGNIDNLLEALDTHNIEGFGSDAETVRILENQIISYELIEPRQILDDNRQRKRRKGAYFKYKHNITEPFISDALKHLQIFDYNSDEVDLEKCLIHSCREQLPDTLIQKMQMSFLTEQVPVTAIDKFGKENNIIFAIRELKSNGLIRVINKGDPNGEHKVDLCYIEEHYFIYKDSVGFTEFYLLNYEQLTPKDRLRTTLSHRHNSKKGMNTFQLVAKLVENKDKFLRNIDTQKQGVHFKQDQTIKIDLDINRNTRRVIPIPKHRLEENESLKYIDIIDDKELLEDSIDCFVEKKNGNFKFWGTFDTETFNKNGETNVYTIKASIIETKYDDKGLVIGPNLLTKQSDDVYNFLNNLVETFGIEIKKKGTKKGDEDNNEPEIPIPKIKLFAHNLTFDLVHILKKTHIKKTIIKDNKFVAAKVHIVRNNKHLEITFVDSYRLIVAPLSKFGKMFNLPVEKEAIYYEMFNEFTAQSNFNLHKDDIQRYIQQYNDITLASEEELQEKERQFWENTHKWDCWFKGESCKDKVKLKKYSEIYCEMDCEVLMKGLVAFDRILKQLDSRLDVLQHCSQSALADYYYKINGCYDNVYELSGFLADYFQGAVVGGRCMLRDNKPIIVEAPIQDFDAVSLYPSAMYLMNGFIMGRPKVLNQTQLNLDFLNSITHYFVTIFIKDVRIKLHMPLMSFIKEDGTREWTNEMEGKTMVVDKYALEDLIEFHQIDFDIIEGYYFNDGYNTKVREIIMSLFTLRLKAKKDGNEPLADVCKLQLNSSYGKTLQKSINNDTKFVNKKDFEKSYFYNNLHSINYFQDIPDSDYIFIDETKSIKTSYNRPHIGATILSYSKRLMNRVICLAENNNIPIFYQDTDSMHLLENDLPKLENFYRIKYNSELVGKSLGQFHSDFGLNGATKNIKSTLFIGLAKKCYLDKLQGENNNGDIINDFHIRMKSIPTNPLLHAAERFADIKDKTGVLNMYKYLADGNSVDFDLGVGGKTRFSVDIKSQKYKVAEPIRRTISFREPDEQSTLPDELSLDAYWSMIKPN